MFNKLFIKFFSFIFIYLICYNHSFSSLLNEYAANEEEILRSNCKSTEIPSNSFIKNYFDRLNKNSSKNNYELLGMNHLSLTQNEFELLKKLLTYEILNSTERFDFSKNCENCNSFESVLSHLFEKNTGLKIAYILSKYGFNTSHFAFINSDAWKDDDLNIILLTLQDFPQTSLRVFKNKQLTHFSHGKTLKIYNNNSNTVANALINIFDSWDDFSAARKQYIIFHEISHNLDKSLLVNPHWKAISGFLDFKNINQSSEESLFISKYAKENQNEDIAETITAYRYNPIKLKTQSSKKYEFIKLNIFSNLEFLDEANCTMLQDKTLHSLVEKNLNSLLKEELIVKFNLNNFFEDDEKKEVLQACKKMVFSYFQEHIENNDEDLLKCFKFETIKRLEARINTNHFNLYDLTFNTLYQLNFESNEFQLILNSVLKNTLIQYKKKKLKNLMNEDSLSLFINELKLNLYSLKVEFKNNISELLSLQFNDDKSFECINNQYILDSCNSEIEEYLNLSQKNTDQIFSCLKKISFEKCKSNNSRIIENSQIKDNSLLKNYFLKNELNRILVDSLMLSYNNYLNSFFNNININTLIQNKVKILKSHFHDLILNFFFEQPDIEWAFRNDIKSSDEVIKNACEIKINSISLNFLKSKFFIPGFLFLYGSDSSSLSLLESYRTSLKNICFDAKPNIIGNKLYINQNNLKDSIRKNLLITKENK